MFIDPWGLVIFLIHGTGSSPATWPDEFVRYLEDKFGEEVINLEWNGANSHKERLSEAERLYYKYILPYIEGHPDEPIRFVGHSHGGNIGILIANMLYENGIQTETLITIATPIRKEYQPVEGAIKQHINVYNDNDSVQLAGGSHFLFFGAKRTFDNAINIKVPSKNDFLKLIGQSPQGIWSTIWATTGIPDHSYMHNNESLWNMYILPRIFPPPVPARN